MRNKFLSLMMFLAALVFFAGVTSAQNPSAILSLRNAEFRDTLGSTRIYEFDVYLSQTGPNAFELAGCQVAMVFRNSVLNSGTPTVTYVTGTSGLSAAQIPANPNAAAAVTGYGGFQYRVLKLASKAPPGAGSGTIIPAGTATTGGVRVGRFKIFNSVAFAAGNSNTDSITFVPGNTGSTTPYGYASKISAYVASVNTDISTAALNLVTYANSGVVNPLPVELSSFTANTSGRTVSLNWKTATEINSSKFEIQRSAVKAGSTERTWTTIGEVSAAGSSNSVKEYSFADKRLQTGKYAYRLKMIDNDGTFEYSKNEVEGEVGLPKEFAISQNYPNPFNPSTRIEYQVPVDARVVVELYSITGEKIASLVNTEVSGGYYTYDLNANQLGLSSGMYLYRVAAVNKATGQAFNQVKKMMMLK